MDNDTQPLDGLVVLDFSWIVAGPQSTRMLADWGAQVIRIEWPQNPDMVRFGFGIGKTSSHEDVFESSGMFNDLNAGKKGITLNMNSEEGRDLFRSMLERADVVVENFSPAAMKKWGFDYQAMAAINPRIIYASISGYGHSGPSQFYVTYGPSAQALNGLTFASGLPGHEPAGWGFSYMDQTAGYVACLAILMAVYERGNSGRGQYLDLAQSETGMALSGAAALDYQVNGRPSRREGFPPGNRATWPGIPVTSSYRGDPTAAPHNAYRCAGGGDNDWCAIAVFSDSQWQALCKAMGRKDMIADPRFATLAARLENQAVLDGQIEAWTRGRGKFEVMNLLQSVGVPAGAVQSSQDRIERDPQLDLRGVYPRHAHRVLGERRFQATPVRMSRSQPRIGHAAPLMGEYNEQIYGDLLGIGPEQVRALVDRGVLWPEGVERPRWVRGAGRPVAEAAQ